MLIPLVMSIAVVIVGNIGLSGFLNSINEEEEASNLSVNNNALIAVVFATFVILVFGFIVKLIYGNKEVKERSPIADRQYKKKKLKNKLKQRKVLEAEEKDSDMVRMGHCNFVTHPIVEIEEQIKKRGDEVNIVSNIDTQEVVNQEMSITDEIWIDVGRKEKRKNSQHLRRDRVSSIEDTSNDQSAVTELSSIDQYLEDVRSVRNIREGIVKEDKGRKRDWGLRRSILKTSEKSGAAIIHPYVSCTRKISAKLPYIRPNLEERNTTSIANNNITHIVSRDAIKGKGGLEVQYLRQGAKPKSGTDFIPRISYAQKVSAELSSIEANSERSITSTVSKSVRHITSRKIVIEGESGLENQYLKQSTKPKSGTDFIPRISYAQKVSAKLLNIKLSSEKRNSSSAGSDKNSIAILKDTIPSSCMDFNQELFMGSGLYFGSVKFNGSESYRKITIRFCNKLKEFRRMHFIYCMKLINKVFVVRDNKLIVSKSVKDLFEGLTPHTEVLFFMLKVFFLISLATLCGGKGMIDHIRYCSTYFYDQSLLDLLLSEVILTSKKENEIRDIFEAHCGHLYDISSHEPYSGKFFQKVFDICYDLASVNLPEEDQELIDFVILTCMVYCGHMVSMLYRMLVYNRDAKGGGKEPLQCYLRARHFCSVCHDLRKAMIHIYHPASEEERPKNVSDVIKIPLVIWRSCSKGVDDVVKKSVSQGKLSFGIFVESMISSNKRLILQPYTAYAYGMDVKMYDEKIKTVASLLPLPPTSFACSKISMKTQNLYNL